MTLTITEELLEIFREIIKEGNSESDWALIESDDMFQTSHFVGGFDATEVAFCFSFYDTERTEYWFQLTLHEIEQFIRKGGGVIRTRPAEQSTRTTS